MSLLATETSMGGIIETPPVLPQQIKLECVITCVNYSDFLAHTLPLNKGYFDKVVVVTAPEDKATQKVCQFWNVQCVLTDNFRSRWQSEFCKGAGINAGLAALDKDAWILHLDADVILPTNFRTTLELADLDTTMIYGCDRAEFKSFADWQKFIGNPEPPIQGNGFFIHIAHTGQQLATRITFQHAGGYVVIGFFQLWHGDSGLLQYPQGHSDAGREDSVFAAQWPRRKRGFLPEIVVYHLESEPAVMGVNWAGRKSKPFGI